MSALNPRVDQRVEQVDYEKKLGIASWWLIRTTAVVTGLLVKRFLDQNEQSRHPDQVHTRS